jgi:predicted nucleic acid-binding protein
MILYLDSSAYIKNYILEPGREAVLSLMEQAEAIAAHELALVEISAAFERAGRERRLDAKQLQRVHAQFKEDWASTLVIATNARLLVDAVRLVQQYPLKAYDAMHLAAAHALQQENHRVQIVFACFDGQLNRAAKQLGLVVREGLS